MIGIEVEVDTNVFYNNKRVCINYKIPEYTLKENTTKLYIMYTIGNHLIKSWGYVLREERKTRQI